MKKIFVAAICCLLSAGCEPEIHGIPAVATFDEASFAPFTQSGMGMVEGHASLQHEGKEPTCLQASLMPSTPYIDNIMEIWQQGASVTREDEARLNSLYASGALRKVRCDVQQKGEFVFRNIPAGKWYVIAPVIQSPLFYGDNYTPKTWGGLLIRPVEVAAGKSAAVDLTLKDAVNGGKFKTR